MGLSCLRLPLWACIISMTVTPLYPCALPNFRAPSVDGVCSYTTKAKRRSSSSQGRPVFLCPRYSAYLIGAVNDPAPDRHSLEQSLTSGEPYWITSGKEAEAAATIRTAEQSIAKLPLIPSIIPLSPVRMYVVEFTCTRIVRPSASASSDNTS